MLPSVNGYKLFKLCIGIAVTYRYLSVQLYVMFASVFTWCAFLCTFGYYDSYYLKSNSSSLPIIFLDMAPQFMMDKEMSLHSVSHLHWRGWHRVKTDEVLCFRQCLYTLCTNLYSLLFTVYTYASGSSNTRPRDLCLELSLFGRQLDSNTVEAPVKF